MKYLTLIAAVLLSGCARQITETKPATIEEWMKVPSEQRLADHEYINLLIQNMRNDPVLYRAVEIHMNQILKNEVSKGK